MNEGETERRRRAREVNYKNDGKMMDSEVLFARERHFTCFLDVIWHLLLCFFFLIYT